jgi:hypothetical protein
MTKKLSIYNDHVYRQYAHALFNVCAPMTYHIIICFIRISRQRIILPSLMSENVYCSYCVFSDRNFIVPLLHQGHPFVYRYRRLPGGYTLHPCHSPYPCLFDFVGIYIYFTQHRKQQRADIYHWYWSFKGYYVCRG